MYRNVYQSECRKIDSLDLLKWQKVWTDTDALADWDDTKIIRFEFYKWAEDEDHVLIDSARLHFKDLDLAS